ncbi:MAG: ATP-dependent helicase [Gemmatimonadaceae bacterium]
MSIGTTNADLLENLNESQREAVLHFEGPLLVLAGAGSGKTRVLTRRVAWLIEHHGVDPQHILSLTFTNKAAEEMRERVSLALGEEPLGMWSGTFHSVGARILRRDAGRAGRTRGFTIYNADDSLATVRHVMEEQRISTKQWSPKLIQATISDAKNALVGSEEYASLAHDPLSKATATVYSRLDDALRESNAVDFDDLLVLPVKVIQKEAELLAGYRTRFQFILVDEYQDTNRAQYQLIKLLGGAHGNVCVVGDDDQSIYGWRGADVRNILDFEKDFPSARVVRLEENYRSTPEVLAVANAVIGANVARRGKVLKPTLPRGDPVTVAGCLDDRDESDWVAGEIESKRRLDRRRELRDFAILYRTNAQSRSLEDSLRRHDMPYRIVGAVRFYDRREIRDVMSYLRLIANPADDEAFLRAAVAPRRGLGGATIELLRNAARREKIPLLSAAARLDLLQDLRPAAKDALGSFAALIHRYRARATDAPVDDLLRELVEEIRYAEHVRGEPDAADRMDNIRELIAGAAEAVVEEGGEVGFTPLEHFLQRASLISDIDGLDPTVDAIVLMTLHNAKGLEFPVVFITGVEEGLFPLSRSHDEPDALEEERRLFYVGITRAEQKLFISHARSRMRNGETMPSLPSSFLASIPPALVEQRATLKLSATGRSVLPQTPSARRPGKVVSYRRGGAGAEMDESPETPRFIKGDRVRHARFGSGTVAEVTGLARDTKVTVDFDDAEIGRKRLIIAYAGLEKEWV